jgi:transcription-repair coupling factor (superfamily II helicase)
LEYVDQDATIWIKDAQFTLDIVKDGLKKAEKLWAGLTDKQKKDNPEWHNPAYEFTDEKISMRYFLSFPSSNSANSSFIKLKPRSSSIYIRNLHSIKILIS